jgi:hypothetical protein
MPTTFLVAQFWLILIGSVWCWSAKRNRRRELSRRSMQRHLERLEAAQ